MRALASGREIGVSISSTGSRLSQNEATHALRYNYKGNLKKLIAFAARIKES